MKIINRVYKYLDAKGVKPGTFEKQIGLSAGYLSKQLKRSADIGESILMLIIENCPDVDPNWLLTGKGEMLKKNEEKSEKFSVENVRAKCEGKNVRATQKCEGNLTPQLEPKQYDPNDGLIHDFEVQLTISELKHKIKLLEKEIDSKEELIQSKDEMIAMQKEAISIATNQLRASTAAMENVAVYLNKGSKKPSTPPDALSASDVDASG